MKVVKILGLTLIVISMIIFLILQFDWIFSSEEKREMEIQDFNYTIQFKHEGDIWALNPEGTDTLMTLPIEIAESDGDIRFGMMERKSFTPYFYGMLFIMPEEEVQSFWMKNTYVPLDIIYINSDREVVSIVQNARPLREDQLRSEAPAKYVLEVPSGFASSRGITKGSKLVWQRLEE